MNNLQRWHIFNSAIAKRHEAAGESPSEKFLREPPSYDMFEARVYRNYKKMSKGIKSLVCVKLFFSKFEDEPESLN